MPILDHLGRPLPPTKPKSRRRIRASYDAAQTTDENRKHWINADSFSANAANDPATRQTLRDRARHECANNSYAAGMLDELADTVIGTGPRLQLSIPGIDRKITRQIEKLYAAWAEQINYAEKLRVAEKAKIRDGEAFILEITNPTLDPFLPQLDLKLYEAEQVSTPFLIPTDPLKVDGIEFDAYGNPQTYHLLKYHPGGEFSYLGFADKEDIPAARMRHYFRPDRPGQARGLPEIMPALGLFAQMRRMSQAVLTAAEFAACISGVLYTDQAPEYQSSDGESGDEAEFDRVEIERGALLTAPKGYKAEGFDPTQPFEGFKEYRGELLHEMGRTTQMPGCVISGDYSQLNYSSGRLAKLPYHRSAKVRRSACRSRVLNGNFKSWYDEARLMGLFRQFGQLPPIAFWTWRWDWDGFTSVDPQKEAVARQTLLAAGLTTLAKEFAEDGEDWEEMLEQRAREQERMKELGLLPTPAPVLPPTPVATEPEGADDPEGEDTPEEEDTEAQVAAAFAELRNDLAHEQIRADAHRRQIEAEHRAGLDKLADAIKDAPTPQERKRRIKLLRDDFGAPAEVELTETA